MQVGRDRRTVMRAVEAAFKAGSGVESIRAAGGTDPSGSKGDLFYSALYESLYHEAEGDAEGSKEAMLRAVATPYAKQAGDYMAALARVHCSLRGWS